MRVYFCAGYTLERNRLHVMSAMLASLRNTCWPIIKDHTQVKKKKRDLLKEDFSDLFFFSKNLKSVSWSQFLYLIISKMEKKDRYPHQRSSTLLVMTHCPACFRGLPASAHVIQMI